MSLFEFDSGHLVPAHFGRPTAQRLGKELIAAVRNQVLELVGRPLFPVVWESNSDSQLLAMDASGQTVTVEVLEVLNAQSLVTALGRAGNFAALGWLDLAAMYPAGQEAFRSDWNEFRESLPPRVLSGPRVIIVADIITDDVRPTLELLSGAGVEVHELTLRQANDGRRMVDVSPVRGPIAQRSQMVLTGRAARLAELPTEKPEPVAEETEPAADDQPVAGDPGGVEEAEAERIEAGAAKEFAGDQQSFSGEQSTGTEETTEAPAGRHAGEVADPPEYTVLMDDAARALHEIAQYVGEDITLVWLQLRRGVRHEAVLQESGVMVIADGREFRDPDAAACAVSGRDDVDGWRVWRFGDAGANLADAREELAEMMEEEK